MIQWTAFLKKEWIEFTRSGRVWIVLAVCIFFGIMNPAIAKLTPWMLEYFSDSFSEMGIVAGQVQIDAMTSWAQFDKNYSLLLILILLLLSNLLTEEYQKGTLIPIITRGMSRWKVLTVKSAMAAAVWTAGYWLCVLITYGYNEYFWANQTADHLFLYCGCLYLAGLWMTIALISASAYFSSSTGVILCSILEFALSYCIGMTDAAGRYVPTHLLNASLLLSGNAEISDYAASALVTGIIAAVHLALAVFIFQRKNLC